MASVHQRYRIIEKIDAGGMAEIYRGEAVSIEGFARQVAIKRILPSMCTDKKFVAMFLDEARLSMQLTHANIVQIFDIGKADDTYFVVMELIDGSNLRRLMQRAINQGTEFPIALACYTIMETAKALTYAHERTNAAGETLGIVHRDVSPPNLLLSKQGEIKLTDFGLAKAASHAQQTDAGVIKGKFAYLSPEVVEGKPADPRADIYSAGIMLWEMLCGRKLFSGKTDMETVELVRKGHVPNPSELRPEIDAELDRIVQKVLAKNPKRRYQSARALEQALSSYLYKHNMPVTASTVGDFVVSMLTTEEDAEDDGFDVLDVLRDELRELARTGHVDPNIGHLPVTPAQLKTRSQTQLNVDDMLAELRTLPLEDVEGQVDVKARTSIADHLDFGEFSDVEQGGGSGSSRIGWVVAAILAAAAVAGAVLVWQGVL